MFFRIHTELWRHISWRGTGRHTLVKSSNNSRKIFPPPHHISGPQTHWLVLMVVSVQSGTSPAHTWAGMSQALVKLWFTIFGSISFLMRASMSCSPYLKMTCVGSCNCSPVDHLLTLVGDSTWQVAANKLNLSLDLTQIRSSLIQYASPDQR